MHPGGASPSAAPLEAIHVLPGPWVKSNEYAFAKEGGGGAPGARVRRRAGQSPDMDQNLRITGVSEMELFPLGSQLWDFLSPPPGSWHISYPCRCRERGCQYGETPGGAHLPNLLLRLHLLCWR